MTATFWQRGETLDYKNTGSDTIEANTIIPYGSRLAIAGTDIKPDELGSIHVTGVFELPKADSTAIAAGAVVYWGTSGITATSGDSTIPAGFAAQAAAASDEVILVKINA